MVQMWWNLTYRLRKAFRWIWLQDGSPAYRARGVAIGVFCGCFPFFGFQALLGFTLASLFRGNTLLAVSGTWISNPMTYVPLYWLNYHIGSVVLDQGTNKYAMSSFGWQEIWEQGWVFCSRLLLGSCVSGLCLGILIGCIVYMILRSRSSKIHLR